MVYYCKEKEIISHCIFGAMKQPYMQEEHSWLALTVIRIAKCKSRKPKKAAGQLLLEIFQEEVR